MKKMKKYHAIIYYMEVIDIESNDKNLARIKETVIEQHMKFNDIEDIEWEVRIKEIEED